MSLTRNGNYNDIYQSRYSYDVGDLRFYFTSIFNRTRFIERLKDNRKIIRTSLTNRFNVSFSADEVADLRLYREVEKRGFRVEIGGIDLCLENMQYVTQLKIREP